MSRSTALERIRNLQNEQVEQDNSDVPGGSSDPRIGPSINKNFTDAQWYNFMCGFIGGFFCSVTSPNTVGRTLPKRPNGTVDTDTPVEKYVYAVSQQRSGGDHVWKNGGGCLMISSVANETQRHRIIYDRLVRGNLEYYARGVKTTIAFITGIEVINEHHVVSIINFFDNIEIGVVTGHVKTPVSTRRKWYLEDRIPFNSQYLPSNIIEAHWIVEEFDYEETWDAPGNFYESSNRLSKQVYFEFDLPYEDRFIGLWCTSCIFYINKYILWAGADEYELYNPEIFNILIYGKHPTSERDASYVASKIKDDIKHRSTTIAQATGSNEQTLSPNSVDSFITLSGTITIDAVENKSYKTVVTVAGVNYEIPLSNGKNAYSLPVSADAVLSGTTNTTGSTTSAYGATELLSFNVSIKVVSIDNETGEEEFIEPVSMSSGHTQIESPIGTIACAGPINITEKLELSEIVNIDVHSSSHNKEHDQTDTIEIGELADIDVQRSGPVDKAFTDELTIEEAVDIGTVKHTDTRPLVDDVAVSDAYSINA